MEGRWASGPVEGLWGLFHERDRVRKRGREGGDGGGGEEEGERGNEKEEEKSSKKSTTKKLLHRQFEGLKSGVGTSYESGFGVTAEPDVTVTGLGAGDEWLIISSDGEERKEVFFLFKRERRNRKKKNAHSQPPIPPPSGLLINVERGGGGGLTNEQACAIAQACGDADEAARALVAAAVEAGSTDDVTVVVFKLGA